MKKLPSPLIIILVFIKAYILSAPKGIPKKSPACIPGFNGLDKLLVEFTSKFPPVPWRAGGGISPPP